MRRSVWLLLISLLPVAAHAADRPDWAFPVADAVQPATPQQDDQPKTLAGSTKSYTAKQIDDLSNPPDWFPDMHPPMPQVVAHGTATFACGSCHLPTGTGHDESAYVAGLPAPYIVQQMADFKSGARKGFGVMPAIAQALTDADFQSAAAYFASLTVRPWVRVVETDTVPKTYVAPGNIRLALPGGGPEPIGNRLVELPEDAQAALDRDPRSGFVVYAPTGSLANGQTLVTNGGGKTTACAICHGAALKGLGTTPTIAGHHANYLVRQLYFFQDGERSGPSAALMHGVAQRLTVDDMLAIAAYLATREP
jgi:cytochrome c553